MITATHIITFKNGTDSEDYDGDLSIQLADQNASWNTNVESGNEDGTANIKNSFANGDTATLAITIMSDKIPYTVKPLVGTATYFNFVLTDVSENLSFMESDEATLSKNPEGEVAYEWQITNPGDVGISVNGKKISLNKKVFGILKVTYKIKILIWRMVYKDGGAIEIPVLLSQNGKTASCNVNYTGYEKEEPGLYNIRIIDHCTKEGVPGASFTFNGKSYITGDDGKVYVGELEKGWHPMGVIKAENYIDSDIDPLDNEGFEVT